MNRRRFFAAPLAMFVQPAMPDARSPEAVLAAAQKANKIVDTYNITLTGATFTAADIRELIAEIEAQNVGFVGK